MTFEELLALGPDEKENLGVVHTPAEVRQQAELWDDTFGRVERLGAEIGRIAGRFQNLQVLLVGAGTSDYIGRSLVGVFREAWRCQVRAVPSTDLLTSIEDEMRFAPEGTDHLWISFSRSGDSVEGVRILERAIEKYPQIRHIVVTCNSAGKMAALAESAASALPVVLDDRTNDRGLAMTGSFTNMVVAGQAIASLRRAESYRPVLDVLIGNARRMLESATETARLKAANRYDRVCFLGTETLKGAADECALKALELSGGAYSVMSETFLGLRHGPLSWLGDNTLVVGLLSNDPARREYETGLLREIRRKNAARHTLVLAPSTAAGLGEIADFVVPLDLPNGFPDRFRPPVDVIFGQLFGLFSALEQGLKPDAPSRDGKIRRVVDGY